MLLVNNFLYLQAINYDTYIECNTNDLERQAPFQTVEPYNFVHKSYAWHIAEGIQLLFF